MNESMQIVWWISIGFSHIHRIRRIYLLKIALRLFQETEYPNYKQLYAKLDKDAAVRNLSEAILRVKNEDFALFLETPYIEYYIGHDCSLQQVSQQPA